jgi:hypothetical protein
VFTWTHDPDAPARRQRSSIWPAGAAAAALVLMVAAGAYFVLRSRAASEATAVRPAERDWTEAPVSAVGPPPAPSPSPPATASASPPAAAPVGGAANPAVAPAQPASSSSGRLLVRSSPEGAVVLVGGKRRGTTPLVLRDLPLGRHDVRVSRPGYAPVERQISLTTTDPSGSLDLALTELVATGRRTPAGESTSVGSIAALSRPSGALVYLDGRVIGRTPLVAARVAPGPHAVRLELGGHRRWSTTIDVKAGARIRVAASLEPGDTE